MNVLCPPLAGEVLHTVKSPQMGVDKKRSTIVVHPHLKFFIISYFRPPPAAGYYRNVSTSDLRKKNPQRNIFNAFQIK